jgi:hypothetical protein
MRFICGWDDSHCIAIKKLVVSGHIHETSQSPLGVETTACNGKSTLKMEWFVQCRVGVGHSKSIGTIGSRNL